MKNKINILPDSLKQPTPPTEPALQPQIRTPAQPAPANSKAQKVIPLADIDSEFQLTQKAAKMANLKAVSPEKLLQPPQAYADNESNAEVERNDQSLFQSIADLSEIFPQGDGDCDESADQSLQ